MKNLYLIIVDLKKLLNQKKGRDIIQKYIRKYPFIKIQIPYDTLGSASAKLNSVSDFFKQLSPFDNKNNDPFGKAFGLFAALLIEVVTLLFNLFFITQNKNLEILKYRMDRSSLLSSAVDEARMTLASFSSITERRGEIDLSFPALLIELARKQIVRNIQQDQKMYCRERLTTQIKTPVKRSWFRKILVRWGVGYEFVYYRIKPEWIQLVINTKETQEDIQDFFQTVDQSMVKAGWGGAIIAVIRQILDSLLRSGEYQENEDGHWIDLSDFNDWFTMVEEKTGIRGVKLPQLSFEEHKMSWNELSRNLST